MDNTSAACSTYPWRAAWRRPEPEAEGQALIIFALFSLVLIGMMALSVDAGFLLAERRQAQSAADAGALAAAKAVFDSKASGEITAVGNSYATFNAGAGSTASTVWPATGGSYSGAKYVRVNVTKNVTRFFLGAIYTGSWQVTATATAGVETNPGDYALIALNKSKTPGIYMNGNTTIVLTGNNASAMSNTNIAANGGPVFKVQGTIDANGSIASKSSWVAPGGINPNFPQVDDPLAGMAAPPKPATLQTLDSTKCNGGTLNPGLYKNQSCTIRGTVKLNPGAYYFEKSSINYQNTNSRMQGTGVSLYFDSASSFDPKNGETSFTAPATPAAGWRKGLVFWYVPCSGIDFQGNGELYFQGVFYAPCADVTMHGNPLGDTIDGQVFVGTYSNKGTSDLKIKYTKQVPTQRPAVFLVQ